MPPNLLAELDCFDNNYLQKSLISVINSDFLLNWCSGISSIILTKMFYEYLSSHCSFKVAILKTVSDYIMDASLKRWKLVVAL